MNRKTALNFIYAEATQAKAMPKESLAKLYALNDELKPYGLFLVAHYTGGDAEAEKEPCPACGQFDFGQTGEYPCLVCGVAGVWDEPIDTTQ